MFKKILICLDGSGFAEQVIQYALDVALKYSARVVLLQAVPPAVPITPGVSVKTSQSLEHSALGYLEGVTSSMKMGGLAVDCVTAAGAPGETIIRYAKENQIDLIAMSTNGRGGLGQTLFGSVAQQVVKESGLPILLVRPSGG